MATQKQSSLQNWNNKTRICPFCGRELLFYKQCDCEEATAQRLEWEREFEEEKKERERKIVYSKLKRAGVPSRYIDVHHEDAKVLAFKISEGTSIFISGANSTLFGCSILNELALTANKRMKFLDATIFCQLMFKQPVETIEDYGKADVLMLNALGNGYANSMTVPFLYQLVNARYNEAKPTIYASSLEFEELIKRLGRNSQDKSDIEVLKSLMKDNCVGWRVQAEHNNYQGAVVNNG